MDLARVEYGISGVGPGELTDASDASFSEAAVEGVVYGSSENPSADVVSVFQSIGESAGLA